jgi:hypothetical protein
MNFLVGNFYASHSGRMPNPTNYLQNFHPYGLCSYCSNPYHSLAIVHHGDSFPIFHMNR